MARRPKTPKWLSARRAEADSPAPGRTPPAQDWLARALGRAGVLAPADVETALAAGRVTVNGRVVRQGFTPLRPGERVELDGHPVDLSPRTLVLAFHKPKGLVVAGRDREGDGTVFERLAETLQPELRGFTWHAVGRLDRDTTGLLLFTNDERFVAHATAPETHLPKRYLVTIGGTATPARLETLERGVAFDGHVSKPAKARLRDDGRLELTLTEGKFHQVKRMLNEVQLATLALHREAVGDYVLDADLVPEGALRRLTDEEVATLLHYQPRQSSPASTPTDTNRDRK